MTSKQREVLNYLLKVGEATKEEIYENVSFGYYYNHGKHLGELLSRMVKSNLITRVRRGKYKAGANRLQGGAENQINLF
jgi:predicted transcriptional regulator